MLGFACVLLALAALNLWATRRVWDARSRLDGRAGWLVAGIWMMPMVGLLVAHSHVRAVAPARASHPGTSSPAGPPAPQRLDAHSLPDFDVAAHLQHPHGVPVLDWAALDAWAATLGQGDAANGAREQGRRAWLLHLRDTLGPGAWLHETEHAMLLSTLEPRVASATTDFMERTRRRVSTVLQQAARFPDGEKSILIVFDTPEDYYHYVSIYYPSEGEFAFSGGMYIHFGCPHFVVVQADLTSIEPAIAHEMTHSALAHLQLPRWLDEGIAVNTEIRLTGARRLLHTPHELHAMHQAFWNDERIQEFWSGRSYDRTDHGNLLSYELGRIIVEQLARDWDRFMAFAMHARRDDAGAGAARQALGTDLGQFPRALLALDPEGDWNPRPDAWPATVG